MPEKTSNPSPGGLSLSPTSGESTSSSVQDSTVSSEGRLAGEQSYVPEILVGPGRFFRNRAEYDRTEAGILTRVMAPERQHEAEGLTTGDNTVDDYEKAVVRLTQEVHRFVERVREGAEAWLNALFDTFEQELFTHAVDKRTFRQLIYQRIADLREEEQQDRGYGIYAPDLFFVNPLLLVRHFVAVQTFGRDAAEIIATAQQLVRLTPEDSAYRNLQAKWMRFHQRELLRDLLAQGFKEWARELRERYPLVETVPGEGLLPNASDWPIAKKYLVAGILGDALVNSQCVDSETDPSYLKQQLAGLVPGGTFTAEWTGKPNQMVVLVKSLWEIVNSSPGTDKPVYNQKGLIIRCLKFFGLEGRRGYKVDALESRASRSRKKALEEPDPALLILTQLPAAVEAGASRQSTG